MAQPVTVDRPLRILLICAALAVIAAAAWVSWDRFAETKLETLPEDGGDAVTQIVSARLDGAGKLQVAKLTGTVQATASDTRALGLLRSNQVVKMPYSVSYFVDVSRLDSGNLQWDGQKRTLIVDAPDVTVDPANTDEGRRTLVETQGLFVTREAAEALSKSTSARATVVAERAAKSPERMAQARELGRAAIARLLAQPLAAAGLGEVRVVVTFPPERTARDGERWDMSKPVDQVMRERAAREAGETK